MDSSVMKRIEDTDSHFRWLIDTIPSDCYGFSDTVKELLRTHKPTNIMNETEQPRTISEIQDFLAEHVAALNNGLPDDQTDASTSAKPRHGVTKATPKKRSVKFPDAERPLSRDALLQRLNAKLSDLKAKRNRKSAGDHADMLKLKRRMSKVKLKMKRSSEKKTSTMRAVGSLKDSESKATATPGDFSGPKPILNSAGKVVFSKFDFAVAGESEAKMHAKNKREGKRSRPLEYKLTGRNYKKLLAVVEKREETLAQVADESPEKAEKLKERLSWQSSLQRAEGIKVKDDPKLLRKALHRKQKLKAHSQKKWEQRQQTVEAQQAQRQAKRQEHLQVRKRAVIQKKIDSARKKGRLVPGF